MRDIQVCDITMKQAAGAKAFSLSFKDKLELAKQLDKLGVSAIEAEGIESPKADSLRIKSLASLVKNCTLAVPVGLGAESVEATWAALKEAAKPRLQVEVAVSPATMEYIHHKKADGMLSEVAATVAACRALCDDVEFVAQDATRADASYLRSIVAAAIEAGAGTVTIADAAGKMLPEEFAAFIGALKADLPQLEQVSLGISCSNELFMADACAVAAIAAGIDAFKGQHLPPGLRGARQRLQDLGQSPRRLRGELQRPHHRDQPRCGPHRADLREGVVALRTRRHRRARRVHQPERARHTRDRRHHGDEAGLRAL